MYLEAWHVDFSVFSQNGDGRKEECNHCLLLDEEVYDCIHSFECSETRPFPCRILEGFYCISLKEVRLYGIAQGSFLSEFRVIFLASSLEVGTESRSESP